MDRYLIICGSRTCEYFCCRCRQLRLSPAGIPTMCRHCGNSDIMVAPVGTLNKAALIRKMDGLTE